jgi:hypothetical protein
VLDGVRVVRNKQMKNKLLFSFILLLACLAAGNSIVLADTTTSTTVFDPSNPPISREQAIEISTSYFPPDIGLIPTANLKPWGNTGYTWNIQYVGINVSHEDLLNHGWKASEITGGGNINMVTINIDASTGAILSKSAWIFRFTQPVYTLTTPPTSNHPYLGYGVGLLALAALGLIAWGLLRIYRKKRKTF